MVTVVVVAGGTCETVVWVVVSIHVERPMGGRRVARDGWVKSNINNKHHDRAMCLVYRMPSKRGMGRRVMKWEGRPIVVDNGPEWPSGASHVRPMCRPAAGIVGIV